MDNANARTARRRDRDRAAALGLACGPKLTGDDIDVV
jgi:hypothetical protein